MSTYSKSLSKTYYNLKTMRNQSTELLVAATADRLIKVVVWVAKSVNYHEFILRLNRAIKWLEKYRSEIAKRTATELRMVKTLALAHI